MLLGSILHYISIELVLHHCCADELPTTSSTEHLPWPVVDVPTKSLAHSLQPHNKNLAIRMDTWTAHALKFHRPHAPPGNLPPEFPPVTQASLICDRRISIEHISSIRSYVPTRPAPPPGGAEVLDRGALPHPALTGMAQTELSDPTALLA